MSWSWNKYRENHSGAVPPPVAEPVPQEPAPPPPKRTDGTPPEPDDE